jgi:hypothetical protein
MNRYANGAVLEHIPSDEEIVRNRYATFSC